MGSTAIIVLLALGVGLVVGSVLLRVRTGGKYEVKTIDLAFIAIPLLVGALATGKVQGVDLFGVKADLSELWADAAETTIESKADAAPATVQDIERVLAIGRKGGASDLNRLIERKVEALEFTLGHGGYYGPAIKEYLEALYGSSHLRVIVVTEPDGTLFGVYNAPDLVSYLRVMGLEGYRQFESLLNRRDETARAALSKFPGFLGVDQAATANTSKRDALASMERLNTDTLAIVDKDRKFEGTIERARLTAKLILSVTDKLAGH